jgi:hypothetical protein
MTTLDPTLILRHADDLLVTQLSLPHSGRLHHANAWTWFQIVILFSDISVWNLQTQHLVILVLSRRWSLPVGLQRCPWQVNWHVTRLKATSLFDGWELWQEIVLAAVWLNRAMISLPQL